MTGDGAFDTILLDHSNEILLLVECETQAIRAANAAAQRHLGYPPEDLIGRPITEIECALADVFYWEDVRQGTTPEVVDAAACYLRGDGEVLEATKTIRRNPENSAWLVIRAVPVVETLRRTEDELAEVSARLRATLEATADAILLLNSAGAIVNMNQRFAQLWPIPQALLVAHDDDAIKEHIAGCMLDPIAYRLRMDAISPHSNDETFDVLHLADGRIFERKSRPARQRLLTIGRVFSFSDVTERTKAETRLKLAASVFTHAHEAIMITDAVGTIVDVNDTFTRITAYPRDEVLGQNVRILDGGCLERDHCATMWRELKTRGHWQGEMWNRRKTGELYVEKLSVAAVCDAEQKSQHYVALFSDITELREHQTQLEHMAHYDALTGVPNRALLTDRLQQAIAQTRRRQRLMAVVYLDLDGFKEVNDTHGRDAGDQLLIAVSRGLKEVLREGDTLARLGGDEFVAVLTDLRSAAECEVILARLLKAASAPVQVKNHALVLSASLGVTLYPLDGSDADTLLRHADHAMYQAKQLGRNRFHMFDPERDRQTQSHRESVEHIAQALARGEFVLHYQPKVNMRTGAVIGAEALIRWQHPERGLLPPVEFLPLIEGSELIARVGDWVLDQAIGQMAAWQSDGFELAVSVNIAALHLQQDGFLSRLQHKLATHPQVPPQRLELEVLETTALEGVVRVSRVIEGCRALGVIFSLDDFGTGYSSLTYLKRLPAAVLKIDQSFVHDMLWDTEDLAIVEGVIGLASAFRRDVIAEGVETTEHGALLLRLGCDLAQGYGIARPMPPEAVPEWVRRWQPQPAWAARDDAPLHRDDLPLAYAEVELRSWVRAVEACFPGGEDAPTPPDTRACRLQEWFGGNGHARYGHLSGFATLDALHERALTVGQGVVAARSAGQVDEAERQLIELRALRDELIGRLYALSAPPDSGPR